MYMFSESQQYDFYVRLKQFSQKKQLPVAAVPLTSLRKVQCRQNHPLYVIYSGDANIGKTIRKVGSCQHSFVLCPNNNAHKYQRPYESKFYPLTSYEVPQGEYRYNSTLSLTWALDGVDDQRHAPGSLLPGMTPNAWYRRLGGPQGRSGQVRNILPPPRFDPRTVQPVVCRNTD
jgi:hypothetical protein